MIVGLGNPGRKYEKTPHNAGFAVVDRLAERLDARLKRNARCQCRFATARHGDEELLLVRPETFMNNSGIAVAAVLAYRKLSLADLIVVVDDADLPLGQLRIRPRGSSGGHRGLASVAEHAGGDDYARIRVGVGRGVAEQERNLVDYVLRRLTGDALRQFNEQVDLSADAVLYTVDFGVEKAMNEFNGRAAGPTS